MTIRTRVLEPLPLVAAVERLMPKTPTSVQSAHDSSTPPSRDFVDDDGARWTVYEQPHGDYDRRSSRSLIFHSEFAVRRVRNFPANWQDLSEAELMELSWNS